MKSKFSTLLVGIALGFGLTWFFRGQEMRKESRPIPAPSSLPRSADRDADVLSAREAMPPNPVPSSAPAPKFKAISRFVEGAAHPAATAAQPTALTAGLDLSEQSIQRMEQERDHLREYASAVQMDDGWRIEIQQADHVFGRAGIRSGDIITYESLKSQLENPERARLASRFTEILHAIER